MVCALLLAILLALLIKMAFKDIFSFTNFINFSNL